MKKAILFTLIGLALIMFFVLSWAPFGATAYVEGHYPGISIGSAALRWKGFTFNDVRVDKPNVKGTIQIVTVDWSKNVLLYGGSLDITIADKTALTKGAPTKQIQGKDLNLTLSKGTARASLTSVAFDAKSVLFSKGELYYPPYTATIVNGVFDRGSHILKAQNIQVPLKLPLAIPGVAPQQTLKFLNVSMDSNSLSFQEAQIGDPVYIKGPSTVTYRDHAIQADLTQISINHPWIAPEAVTFPTLEITVPTEVLKGRGDILVKIGSAVVQIDPIRFSVKGQGSCNDWVEAMPEPRPVALQEARGNFKGDLSFEVVKDPTPQLKIKNTCKFECRADPIADLKDGQIVYMAYDKNDKQFPRRVGVKEPDWVEIEALPPNIPNAFISLEDPGFNLHRGVIPQALENSLKDNLRMGRFFRGGSTITMQLAKNVWLKRQKTLGRKAQEIILTLALESCMTKAEILELYLNVVEFGPDLYGIGPAAKYYFDKQASKLETDEAFYLASILPRPRKAVPPKQGGLDRTRAFMRTLAKNGLINSNLAPLGDVDSSGWDVE